MNITGTYVSESAENASGSVAPRDDFERRLVDIWTQVLGRSSIGVTDNFYEIGGDSLAAVQVISQIEAEFAVNIPPSRLYEAPTIEEQARVIVSGKEQAQTAPQVKRTVFEVSASKSGTPLFCFPGNCGRATLFYPLAESLGTDQGVSVVLYSYLEQNAPPPSMKKLAASCVENIRSVQASGPYHLGGYCFGASVAYEAARQLHAAGEEVTVLALLDPEPETAPTPFWNEVLRLAKKCTNRIRAFVGPRWLAPPSPELVAPEADLVARFQIAAYLILKNYTHRPYAGCASLFYSDSEAGLREKDTPFWRERVRGVLEIHSIPGNHLTMLEEPNVSAMTKILHEQFDKSGLKTERPV